MASGSLFAQVQCEKIEVLDKGVKQVIEVACRYQSMKPASDLQNDMIRSMRALGYEFVDNNGYIQKGDSDYELEFFHNDPYVLSILKRLVLRLDRQSKPPLRTPVMVEVSYYYFSNTVADEKGFSLDFLFDGLVNPDMPKASLSGGSFAANLGNLSNHWFGVSINYANRQEIITHSYSLQFDSHDGKSLNTGEVTQVYRDNFSGRDVETAKHGVSGQILVDEEEPGRIYIKNFALEFPTIVDTNYSILNRKVRQDDYLELRDGEVKVLLQQDVKEMMQSEDGKLLGFSDANNARTYKFIATIKLKLGKKRNVKQDTLFNPSTQVYSFSEDFLENLENAQNFNFKDLFGKDLLELKVYQSPYGVLGNGIGMQFVSRALNPELLKMPVIFEVYGDSIDFKSSYRVENLLAGPILLSDFDSKKMQNVLEDTQKIKFIMRIGFDKDMQHRIRSLGMDYLAADYLVYYFPKTGDAYLQDVKYYRDLPKADVKKVFKGSIKRRR
jgi:hypothetical protein